MVADPSPISARLSRLLAISLALAGGVMVVWGGASESLAVPLTRWRISGGDFAWAGVGLLALAVLAAWMPPRVAMAFGALAWTLLACFALGQRPASRGDVWLRGVAAGVDEQSAGDQPAPDGVTRPRLSRVALSADEWFEDYVDPNGPFGRRGIPHARGHAHQHEFDVDYTLDADGFRVMPAAKSPGAPTIALVGCSYPFGIGVEDDETFPAILAREAWTNVRLRNCSIPGWGTPHALMFIEELLCSDDPPQGLIYCWISHHLRRNYLRRDWHHLVNGQFPFFDFVDHDAVYRGLWPRAEATWDESAELDAREAEMSLALLESMRRLCALNDVPLVVLVIHRIESDPVPAILLADHQFQAADVSAVSFDFYPVDRHPTARWHRLMARALARDERFGQWLRMPKRLAPAEIAPPPATWKLSLRVEQGADGRLRDDTTATATRNVKQPPERGGTLSLSGLRLTPDADPWAIQVQRAGLKIERGREYELSFRVRSAAPRELICSLTTGAPDFTNVGLFEQVNVTQEWREVRVTFTASIDADDGVWSFAVGASDAEVEWKDLRLTCEGRDLLD